MVAEEPSLRRGESESLKPSQTDGSIDGEKGDALDPNQRENPVEETRTPEDTDQDVEDFIRRDESFRVDIFHEINQT